MVSINPEFNIMGFETYRCPKLVFYLINNVYIFHAHAGYESPPTIWLYQVLWRFLLAVSPSNKTSKNKPFDAWTTSLL